MLDIKSDPFKTMVVLGESTVQGGPWLAGNELRWADILRDLINSCQTEPISYCNEGIGASVISKRSAGYADSNKPSAIERYKERVIAHNPDLFVMAYGLNDMRCATDINILREDMEKIIIDVKKAYNSVIVLVNIYHMTGFDRYPPFDKGSINAAGRYNQTIADLAVKNDCLLVDVWSAMNCADWLVHNDGVHANAVGNMIVAHEVFKVIASNCSCLSVMTNDIHKDSEWTRITKEMAYTRVEPSGKRSDT